MNNLITITENKELTMSSMEIAKLLESRHDKVKQSIERLAARGVITRPPMGETSFIDKLGKTQWTKEYRLIKRDTYVVVAQLSPEFTARLVDRWQQLEEQQTFTPARALNDPAIMRSLLLNYSEKVLDLEQQVTEMLPQAQIAQRISLSDGAMCITDAAKTLQIQPKLLFAFLSENKWIYRRAGNKNWIAYQDKLQSGVLEHKITTVIGSDGVEHTREQVLVTRKGITKLAQILNEEKEAASC